MSVLSPPWPAQPPYWNGHSAASFSALAAPVIPPLDPDDISPFPSPSHGHEAFSALAASPPRRSTHPYATPPRLSPVPGPSAFSGVPPRNARSLDGDALVQILDFLSTLLPARFGNGQQIRLVIHGGAVMLLNADLARLADETAATDGRAKQRTTTRDIDYIARSFSSEWAQRYGVYDANERLKQCTFETALQFGLGADWMNSDADVALPMAADPTTGALYDPIHAASIQTGDSLTVYTSPNGLLKLVSVTPFWTVALKMVRYNAADREDICILLRSGTRMRQMHWTPTRLEVWLLGACWAMGYAGYDAQRLAEMRRRMVEVVAEVNRWDPEAVADDGCGGTVPLRGASQGYGSGYGYGGYAPPPPPLYAYAGGDSRLAAPFRSPSPRAHTFPPAGPPSPFFLGPAPTPPPPPPPKRKKKDKKDKTKKRATTTAVTTWPSHWTPPQQQELQRWDADADPESPERWNAAVTKEKKVGRMTSWLPFLKSSKSTPALTAKRAKHRRRYDDFSDDSDSETDVDSESEDEDWLGRERRRWEARGVSWSGGGGGGGFMAGVRGAFHANVADFMSGGLTPTPPAAPPVMPAGPGNALPGWNVPGAQSPPPWHGHGHGHSHSQSQSPQSWYPQLQSHPQSQSPPPPPWMYAGHRSPAPQAWQYPAPQARHRSTPAPGADMRQATASMNALGLYDG
ncbi:hypothetical protein FB451DRAFT_594592 [Mycena latifolia]|nr:hypothetical protein FB451DRAFT_594592 [Mycena latifolia]